jgi:hypothetical protein
MYYTFATEYGNVGPVSIMRSGSKSKKNYFLTIREIPMTKKQAVRAASFLDTALRNAKLKK